jgi:hypothetical protein
MQDRGGTYSIIDTRWAAYCWMYKASSVQFHCHVVGFEQLERFGRRAGSSEVMADKQSADEMLARLGLSALRFRLSPLNSLRLITCEHEMKK